MTPPNAAVFLSYASEDAEAAGRIAAALAAVDTEVWFDRSALRGGDAWDQKIRDMIKRCALFVPIVSAHTQERAEGYFRLEWHLAEQRSLLMAHDRPFIVPVTIDDTAEDSARVPARFLERQWTRLPGGETSAAFVDQIKRLLAGHVLLAEGQTGQRSPSSLTLVQARWRNRLAVLCIAVLVTGAIAYWHPWSRGERTPDSRVPAATAKAQVLMAQALALIDDPDTVGDNYRLADELCHRALELDAADAEIWAGAARVSQEMYTDTYDLTPRRLEQARDQAERAIRLNPRSISAGVAVARNFRLSEQVPAGIRLLKQLLARAPDDRLTLRELARQEREIDNDAEVRELLARIRALPGGDPRALVTEARDLRERGRFPEAEIVDDELLAGTPIRLAYYEKFLLLANGWSDLTATKTFIATIPERFMQQDAFAELAAVFWIRAGDGNKALAALAKTPHEYLEEFAANVPKSYLAGWAYAASGRRAAARAEWEKALALVETRLAADRSDPDLLANKAHLQALLGKKAPAQETWKLVLEFSGSANRVPIDTELEFRVAVGEIEDAISLLEARWPKVSFAQRSRVYGKLRYGPELAAMRSDRRIAALLAEHAASLSALRDSRPARNGGAEIAHAQGSSN